MQYIIFHKVDVPGPLLGREPLQFNSCKQPPPVSDHSVFAFWGVAYRWFDCIKQLTPALGFYYML